MVSLNDMADRAPRTLEDGETIDQFLDQFPTVTREQVNGILELSKERLLEGEIAA